MDEQRKIERRIRKWAERGYSPRKIKRKLERAFKEGRLKRPNNDG
jgi:hypothetical protein